MQLVRKALVAKATRPSKSPDPLQQHYGSKKLTKTGRTNYFTTTSINILGMDNDKNTVDAVVKD